jgi:Tol biopolymer transport system component
LSGAGIILVLGFGIAIWQALRSRSLAPLGELEQRQLTANSAENTVWSGAISPSGKYLAYVDSTGIRLKQIESGDLGTVPEPAGLDARRVRWHIASWFPDNSGFIAVALQPQLNASTWAVSLVGMPPRLLRENARAWSVSPDGKWIAFTASTRSGGSAGQCHSTT